MPTTLMQLLGDEKCSSDAVVNGLAIDSRRVLTGDLFVAVPGAKLDGRQFISEAVKRGASAIVTVPGGADGIERGALPVVEDNNPRQLYAKMAAKFCGPQPIHQVAVTGTNGKTSVADFVKQLWQLLGIQAASIGTLGVRSDVLTLEGGLTTPDPLALHSALARLKAAGIDHVAVEASSHGLSQFRLDGTQLQAAAFTNLTRDHLDYHGTEDAYFKAKARLFTELVASGGTAIINLDDPYGQRVHAAALKRGLKCVTFGKHADASMHIRSIENIMSGQAVRIAIDGEEYAFDLPLVGEFQVFNALAALGLALEAGAPLDKLIDALPALKGVPGRMELIGQSNGAGVFVDYAHTPDGLQTVLKAARAHCKKNVHVIFGCGGDRDAGKRPQMGSIAQACADFVYVTDDNPRSEDAQRIRSEIMAACPGAIEIADRAEAIEAAVRVAEPGDMIIVAGKGHETGQIIGDKVKEYSDILTVKALLDRENHAENMKPHLRAEER